MRAISQAEHARINAREYPGTRQICDHCGMPTNRTSEDGFWDGNDTSKPLCHDCWCERVDGGFKTPAAPQPNQETGEQS